MKSVLLVLTAFLISFSVASAASKKSTEPKPAPQDTISAVDAKNHQVTIHYLSGKATHIYTIDDLSTVTLNNVSGKFSDIRVGMVVKGSTERDDHTLDNITLEGLGLAPSAPAPKPAKTKPKAKS